MKHQISSLTDVFVLNWSFILAGRADLYENGDHSDAMRALSCLGVVGIQVLVIMDQLDLKERHMTQSITRCESDFSITLYGCDYCNNVMF